MEENTPATNEQATSTAATTERTTFPTVEEVEALKKERDEFKAKSSAFYAETKKWKEALKAQGVDVDEIKTEAKKEATSELERVTSRLERKFEETVKALTNKAPAPMGDVSDTAPEPSSEREFSKEQLADLAKQGINTPEKLARFKQNLAKHR